MFAVTTGARSAPGNCRFRDAEMHGNRESLRILTIDSLISEDGKITELCPAIMAFRILVRRSAIGSVISLSLFTFLSFLVSCVCKRYEGIPKKIREAA